MIRLQRQPSQNTCGQTCVAMVLGVDAASVIAEMGSRRTTGRELVAFLRARGVAASGPQRISDVLPPTSIARVAWRWGGTHWVLIDRGRVFDPVGIVDDILVSRHRLGWRVLSALPVRLP